MRSVHSNLDFWPRYYLPYYPEHIPVQGAEQPLPESVNILNHQASSISCGPPPVFLCPFSFALLILNFFFLTSDDVLPQVLMEYFLVVLYPRLVKRIYVFHGSFIGNGEEEEIHECPYVKRC